MRPQYGVAKAAAVGALSMAYRTTVRTTTRLLAVPSYFGPSLVTLVASNLYHVLAKMGRSHGGIGLVARLYIDGCNDSTHQKSPSIHAHWLTDGPHCCQGHIVKVQGNIDAACCNTRLVSKGISYKSRKDPSIPSSASLLLLFPRSDVRDEHERKFGPLVEPVQH